MEGNKLKHISIRTNRVDLPLIAILIFIEGIKTNFCISLHYYTLELLSQDKFKCPLYHRCLCYQRAPYGDKFCLDCGFRVFSYISAILEVNVFYFLCLYMLLHHISFIKLTIRPKVL